ncbi:PLP-dependent transferase, partial [Pseudomonas syringae pv. tagetis]|uniref:PLP-dependent transferase n=1 Tax=Pseudomonas syringae group genomosp. 7 TaxID=251699 RepID=UPI00376F7891
EVPGIVYSRYTNPTVRSFEERFAALEGAEQAVATATGIAATLAVVMSLCSAGDLVLVSRSVFGSTISLFVKYFKRFG